MHHKLENAASASSPRHSAFGNHNRSWLWGRHAVLETLRADRWRPLELALSPRCPLDVAQEVRIWAGRHAVALKEETDDALAKRCRSEQHQGLAARLPEFPYVSFEDLLAQKPFPKVWLVLDRIQDAHNFGAMVRSAAGLGVDAIVLGTTEQSPVNRQVVQSSAGAVNLLSIARVDCLEAALDRLGDHGVMLVAASEKGTVDLHRAHLAPPVAVIIGNEGQGVQRRLWDRCSQHVRIPMASRLGSLNAAVAAGIICYEVWRQRSESATALPDRTGDAL